MPIMKGKIMNQEQIGEKILPLTREQEIIGWLSAYREGTLVYDREHVLELLQELTVIRGKVKS